MKIHFHYPRNEKEGQAAAHPSFMRFYLNVEVLTFKFHERSVSSDNIVHLHEDTLHDGILIRCQFVFHLHRFLDNEQIALLHFIAGLDTDFYHLTAHRRAFARSGDG